MKKRTAVDKVDLETSRMREVEAERHEVLSGIPVSEITPAVRKAISAMEAEIKMLRVELSHAQGEIRKLEKLADGDPLLNMFNRRAFDRELNRTLAMVDRHQLLACLIYIDLNGLKKINDQKGHQAGDAALLHVSTLLCNNIRQTDIAGRLGGDEFGVILTHVDVGTAEKKAAELASLIANAPVEMGDHTFPVSIAYGVVALQKDISVEEIMARADQAMYAAKHQ